MRRTGKVSAQNKTSTRETLLSWKDWNRAVAFRARFDMVTRERGREGGRE